MKKFCELNINRCFSFQIPGLHG